MAESDHAGRIPKPNLLAASITLFAISIVIALARTAIRLRYQGRLFVDDAILLVAIVCLCAAMTLLLVFTPSLYLIEAFVTSPPASVSPEELEQIEVQLEQPLFKYLKLSDSYYVMTWTTIFAVKFSFLFFFRVLIRRVRAVTLYWQVVSVVTVLVWVYCIAGAFIICPYFDSKAFQCAQDSQFSKALGVAASNVALDIVTDILIMIIPIYLLWHVQIKIRQKLALAVSLCLSIMMVILAIVRISRFRSSSSTIDFTWDIFWQFAESCTAVTMVSFTAFRSLFVAHATQQSPKKSSYSSWRYPRAEKRQRDAEALDGESQEMQSLPERPRPALTGMRTSIRGERANSKGGFLKTKGSDGGDEPWPLQDEAGGQGIRVHHSVSMDTEVISHAGQKPEYRNFV